MDKLDCISILKHFQTILSSLKLQHGLKYEFCEVCYSSRPFLRVYFVVTDFDGRRASVPKVEGLSYRFKHYTFMNGFWKLCAAYSIQKSFLNKFDDGLHASANLSTRGKKVIVVEGNISVVDKQKSSRASQQARDPMQVRLSDCQVEVKRGNETKMVKIGDSCDGLPRRLLDSRKRNMTRNLTGKAHLSKSAYQRIVDLAKTRPGILLHEVRSDLRKVRFVTPKPSPSGPSEAEVKAVKPWVIDRTPYDINLPNPSAVYDELQRKYSYSRLAEESTLRAALKGLISRAQYSEVRSKVVEKSKLSPNLFSPTGSVRSEKFETSVYRVRYQTPVLVGKTTFTEIAAKLAISGLPVEFDKLERLVLDYYKDVVRQPPPLLWRDLISLQAIHQVKGETHGQSIRL